MEFGIGQSVPRSEDPRFLKGSGRYVADIAPPRTVHAYVLRSPHAHARLRSIDIAAALAAPGVLLVVTGSDIKAEGLNPLSCDAPPVAFRGPVQAFMGLQSILANERVRYVGDPVALVVAETLHQARDAAENIHIDYEVLPAAVVTGQATQPGAPLVWDDAPDNIWFAMNRGDKAKTDAALDSAAHIVTLRIVNNRISANSIEARTTLAEHDAASLRTTLYTSSQVPHVVRSTLASVFNEPPTNFRVICPDVGGGFGMKAAVYPEDALAVFAARKLNRPIKWVSERSEAILIDNHGRDCVSEASLALDIDGKFTGLRVEADFALGSYLSTLAGVPAGTGSLAFTNVYNIPAAHISLRTVYTHTTPIGVYRGAGKPEAIYVIERLIDTAARELNIDAIELRRRNLITAAAVPYQTQLDLVHDSANYASVMDMAVDVADWDGFAERKANSRLDGRLRGRGVAFFTKVCGPFNDRMEIRFDEGGNATIVAGTHSHGQGHQTAYAQMLTDWLGIDFNAVRLIQGDTDHVAFGRGTYASRSMIVGGSALFHASENIIEKGRQIAAHLFEAAVDDVNFENGKFTVVGTDKALGVADLAKRSFAPVGWPAELGVGLEAVGTFTPADSSFANGCHIAEVEVDPETGAVNLVSYTAVDDSGVTINPLLLHGQIHGGVAQGIGQALRERIAFDVSSGQPLSGSFMDYCMPRAEHIPAFAVHELPDRCRSNPIGVRGVGESGTVAAPPTVINAIIDAIADSGVTDIEMPATAARVWEAIHASRK